jgi:hypothetical protein
MARPVDLAEELASAVIALRSRDRLRLADYGVGTAEVLAIGGPVGAVGVARIALERGGLYRPDPEEGEPAIILPPSPPPAPIVDLVAWRPWANERVLARRCGFVVALGEAALCPFGDRTLRLWRSPASWAAAGCDGAVILNWHAAAAELLGFDLVIAEDIELAEEAERHIRAELRRTTPRAPVMEVAA